MSDIFTNEGLCYEYFINHKIKTRNELRSKLKDVPIPNIRQTFIEEMFSNYKREIMEIKAKKEKKDYTIICINDLHIPHHDNKVVELVFSFIKQKQPDELVLNGDILDCYWVSSFLKNPSSKVYLQDECNTFYKLFNDLRKHIPNTIITFINGNHEDRILKETWKNPAFYGIKELEIEKLLKFDKLRINYQKNRYIIRDFLFTHGEMVSKHSSFTAKAEFERHKCRDGMSGHTHRLGCFHQSIDGITTSWYENGCLCTLNPEYVKEVVNWQHGFSVINFYDKLSFVQPILIKEGKFIYEGVLYQ